MTTTRLIAVRHGNTFKKGDTLLRVGKRTDLDLVESEKGTKAGLYIKNQGYNVDHIYTGPLKRQVQTADLINQQIHVDPSKVTVDLRFNELDYGEHDGMPEAEVVKALGEETLKQWDAEAVVPEPWDVDTDKIKQDLTEFLEQVIREHSGKDVLVVTSNGLLRFLPFVIGSDTSDINLKVATGGVVVLEKQAEQAWQIAEWGIKP